ncbi:sulfonate transport system substrate-binding protein [Silvimonas terrae]|uniref:Sulfonate transport system substrate-binding protein n=1 Tax=Silvimonas terrae TaxID=300266 RepID=A0A840RF41_9NEIS|nr:ABC transporter substrate-binding protein [Silvimonas terrae]MBB5191637.1 sulfonate transport system substrate-binding protein [Silvimonas terrae]
MFSLKTLRGPLARLALALTAFSVTVGAYAETPPTVIRVGVATPKTGNPPAFTVGPVGVAYTRGLIEEEFKKDNVKIDWVFFRGAGPAVNEALTNKQLDFAFQGDLPSLVGKAGGLNTRLIALAGTRQHVYLAVPPDSPIKSVKDLKGKRVGFSIGTNIQTPINRILAANGLTERDIRVVNLSVEGIAPALTSKSIDAVFSWVQILPLKDKGLARIVFSDHENAAYACNSGVLVTDEFARKYPQTTTRLLKALLPANRWLADPANTNAYISLVAQMGFPEKTLHEDQDGEDALLQSSPLLTDYALSLYQGVADDAFRLKLARTRVDVKQWADRSFLTAALQQAQLTGFWPTLDNNGRKLAAK